MVGGWVTGALGFVFDGAGRWLLALAAAGAVVAGFCFRENKIERLTRADERAAVTDQIREKTHATVERIQGAAARGADKRVRGVLDPTTRD